MTGDLGDVVFLEQIFGQRTFDAVLHFAAFILVPDSMSQPLAYYGNDLADTLRLLQACEAHGAHRLGCS